MGIKIIKEKKATYYTFIDDILGMKKTRGKEKPGAWKMRLSATLG